MKKMQLFIHRHYETIKLVLLVVIFIVAFFSILDQIQRSRRDSEDRADAVKTVLAADREIINAIKAETENQTIIINRQFRALCILIIETSGQAGLDKLDPDSRARCEALADEPTADGVGQENPSGQSASPRSQSSGQSSSSPQNTPNSSSNQPDNSQNPPAPDNEGVIIDLPLLPRINIPSPL